MVIELVEMTISTKYSGFDKLNRRFSCLLDSPESVWQYFLFSDDKAMSFQSG